MHLRSTLGLALAILLVAAATPADADESEASLAVEAGPAFLRVEDIRNSSGTTVVAGGGGGARFSYGLSDLIAVEVSAGGFLALNAEYRGIATDMGEGNVLQDVRGLRATVGAEARLGARIIPTAGLHVGYQRRATSNAVLFDDANHLLAELPARSDNDLLAIAALGVELRLDRRWLVGVAAQASLVVGAERSFVSFDFPVRLTYAWYPGWFRSTRVLRFDD